MVLDIAMFREKKGGDPNRIRESERRRFADPANVDLVIALDEQWREARGDLDALNRELKELQTTIGSLRKEKKEVPAELSARQQDLKTKIIKEKEEEIKQKEVSLLQALTNVGNIVHEDVPVSSTEDDNQVIKQWAPEGSDLRPELPEPKLSHDQLLWRIGGYDPDRGVKITGHRGYFMLGSGVLLQQALVRYSIDFLVQRGYSPIQVPLMMNQDIMAETAELAQFDEELYKVTGVAEPKYLIATSEQPISAYYRGEWLDPKILPIKFAGYSSCFRKEAGAAGRDTRGIFRVHQFEKVEQFCITDPESSWACHKEMVQISEDFLQSLKIPYQVIAIVSSALNKAAAMKYDIEAWFPSFPQYKEVVSCSNCTDYQSRRLEIRFGSKKAGEKEKKYVHMLNGTMCATTRVLSVILEHYQTPEGVRIPDVLIPFMHLRPGAEPILPFVQGVRDAKEAKGKGKQPSKEGAN